MSDLMPCQMCGCTPQFMDNVCEISNVVYEFDQVGCPYCRLKGPAKEWKSTTKRRDEFREHIEKESARCKPLAAKKWNELQRLIARGKLLDQPSSQSKGGRL